jgi:hypothetical protein
MCMKLEYNFTLLQWNLQSLKFQYLPPLILQQEVNALKLL